MALRTVGLALLAASIAAAQDSGKVALEWKFRKGDVLRFEMKTSTETEFAGMIMDQEMVQKQAMEIVEVGPDGTASVRSTFERIKVSMSGPMSTDYDSDRDKVAPQDPMGRVMAALVGKSLTLRMSRRGEVLDVKGYREVMKAAFDDLREDNPELGEGIEKFFDDEYATHMMQMGFLMLPAGAVGSGESWETDGALLMPMLGKMSFNHKATLKEVRSEGREAVVDQVTRIGLTSDEGPMGEVELSDSKFKSQMVWRVDRGLMESMKGSMSMTLSAGGQDVLTTMKMEMKLLPTDESKPGKPKDPPERKSE